MIRTTRLELKLVTLDDVEWIVKCKDDDLVRAMSVGLYTEVTFENQLEDVRDAIDSKHQLYYILNLNDENIGYIRLDYMDFEHKYAWLRFGMLSHRGEGYCREGLIAVINDLFSRETVRIEAEVYDFNLASYRLLESIGFVREGLKRKAHFEIDYHDVYVYGLLKEEFNE